MKWTCESMNPGVTMPPLASISRAEGAARASLATSALEPTATILSPETASAVAQGCVGLPVQTRAFTTASAIGAVGVMRGAQLVRDAAARDRAKTRLTVNSQRRLKAGGGSAPTLCLRVRVPAPGRGAPVAEVQ